MEMNDPRNSNLDDLITFVTAFNYELITISIQPEAADAFIKTGKWFSNKNRVRAFTITDFLSDDVQLELRRAQVDGNAIYFMINEGDGIPHDAGSGNLNCGRRSNVRTLKTFAIDSDGADINALDKQLEKLNMKPHLVVETSPGRFHYYFLIGPMPAEGENILMWQATQKKLASLVPGLDQSMTDINQVLRLPTFHNLKRATTHLVKFAKSEI